MEVKLFTEALSQIEKSRSPNSIQLCFYSGEAFSQKERLESAWAQYQPQSVMETLDNEANRQYCFLSLYASNTFLEAVPPAFFDCCIDVIPPESLPYLGSGHQSFSNPDYPLDEYALDDLLSLDEDVFSPLHTWLKEHQNSDCYLVGLSVLRASEAVEMDFVARLSLTELIFEQEDRAKTNSTIKT